jgi:transposase, IS5 family
MRKTFTPQLELGATPIETITFNARSRDDIPQILRGLQHIYQEPSLRDRVFDVLRREMSKDIDFTNGRPGMDLWVLLVLGVLRVGLNCDYDRLHELANEHKTIRAMLGHSDWQSQHQYALQTLKDNVMLLTEEMLVDINEIVVSAGHQLVKKKENETLAGRCDSFVVETNVEYPTDMGMLFDAIRRTIILTAKICHQHNIPGWRQWAYRLQRTKNHWRKAQQSQRSRKEGTENLKQKAFAAYCNVVDGYYQKSLQSLQQLQAMSKVLPPKAWSLLQDSITEISGFHDSVILLRDQIKRRVLKGEVIPSSEKIYSIFEPHTEWVAKGKAGVPVELGLKVCVIEDQYQFILHHHVMEKTQDVDVALKVITAAQKRFPSLKACSFDKGFHSPLNQIKLAECLDEVTLPKKGKRSSEETAKEHSESFRKARRQHSAVESAIHALEHSGLDRCFDHGINGFKRYVALGVVSRNLQRVGSILVEKERALLKRMRPRERYAQAA